MNFNSINDQLNELIRSQKQILTISEVSEWTGLSKSFLYKLTSQRRIPFYKPCKQIFFKREDIEAWLLSNPISPAEDEEQEAMDYLNPQTWKEVINGK